MKRYWSSLLVVVFAITGIISLLYADISELTHVQISRENLQNVKLGELEAHAESGTIKFDPRQSGLVITLEKVRVFVENSPTPIIEVPSLEATIDTLAFLTGREVTIQRANLYGLQGRFESANLHALLDSGDLDLSGQKAFDLESVTQLLDLVSVQVGESRLLITTPGQPDIEIKIDKIDLTQDKFNKLYASGNGQINQIHNGGLRNIATFNVEMLGSRSSIESATGSLDMNRLNPAEISYLIPKSITNKKPENESFVGAARFAFSRSDKLSLSWDLRSRFTHLTGNFGSYKQLATSYKSEGVISTSNPNWLDRWLEDHQFQAAGGSSVSFKAHHNELLEISDLNAFVEFADVYVDSDFFIAPQKFDSFEGNIAINPTAGTYEIKDAIFVRGDAKISLDGEYNTKAQTFAMRLNCSDIALRDVVQLIPPARLPAFYPWLENNIINGKLQTGQMELAFVNEKMSKLNGSFTFDNASVIYLSPLDEITQAAGRVRFNSDLIQIDVDSGNFSARQAGLNEKLKLLSGAKVEISISEEGDKVKAEFALEGSAATFVGIVDDPSIQQLTKRNISFKNIRGEGIFSMIYGQPLVDNVSPEDITFALEASLSNFAYDDGPLGAVVSDAHAHLKIDKELENLSIVGRGIFAGTAIDLNWQQKGIANLPAKRDIQLTGYVKLEDDQIMGMPFAKGSSGSFDMEAQINDTNDTEAAVSAAFDIKNMDINFDPLALIKPDGAKGDINIKGTLQEGGTLVFKDANIKFGSFDGDASGSVNLVSGELRNTTFASAKVGRNLEVEAAVSQYGDQLEVIIKADTLDLYPLISHASDKLSSGNGTKNLISKRHMRVIFEGKKAFLTSKDHTLDNISGDISFKEGNSVANSFLVVNGDGSYSLKSALGSNDLSQEIKEGEPWRVNVSDAGAFMNKAAGIDFLKGGEFYGEITLVNGQRQGKINLRDAVLVQSPGILSVLDALSLTGLLTAISGEDLAITKADGEITYDGSLIQVNKMWITTEGALYSLHGSLDIEKEVLDMEGTFSPIYLLNSAVGNLPIVGHLLSDPETRTLLATNFTLKGSLDDVTVNVNPISAFAPGLLKRVEELAKQYQ